MGNPLGVQETNYKVKKVKNLLFGKIWPPTDLLFLELSYCTRKKTTTYPDSDGNEKRKETRSHRWEHWEQLERRNMMYLRSDRRFKMGKAINNYLLQRT